MKLIETGLVVESTKTRLKAEGTFQYEQLATSYAENIAKHLDMYFGHMDMYCKSDVVRTGSESEIQEWLVDHADLRDEDFDYISYFNLKGGLFTDLGTNSDISDRDYFDAIVHRNKDHYIDDPVTSKTTGQSIVHICRPVYDENGKLKGGIAAIVNVTNLSMLLEDVDLGKEGAAILFSSQSVPITTNVSAERAKELTSDPNLTKEFMRQIQLQGESGNFFAKHLGQEMLIIYTSVDYAPWNITMMISSNQVKNSSYEMAEGNKAILDEIKNLQNATFQIKTGMEEMSAGARKINETGATLSNLTSQMKGSIQQMGDQVDQFKV